MVSFGSQVDFSVPHLKIRGLNKFYEVQGQRLHALKDINVDIPKAQIVGIIGKSGAGKSSLLRTLNGLESIDTGSILIHQQNIAELSHVELIKTRQKIGMIFQHFNLMSAKTVWENVALPLRIAGYDKAEIEQRVSDVLTLVGLAAKRNDYPAQLSGGQKQRVGIARALVSQPEILLCDEATSALDPESTANILSLLKQINRDLGLTIVLITHEMQIVKDIANRVAVMQNGELIEEGSVLDIFSNPKNGLTQDFITVATGIDEAMVKINQQAIVKNLPDDSILAHLKYAGSVTDTAIINDIYKQYQISANILFGNIEILDNTPVGELVVILSGETQNLETAKAELENAGVSVTIVKDGRKA